MAITITRTSSNLIGSPGSPASLAAATPVSGTLDMTSPAGVVEGSIGVELIMGGTAPTTSPTVQFFYSLDGTTFIQDGGTITLTVVASTSYDLRYDAPDAASKVKVTVTNGATNGITLWAQGQTLAVS